ncbi:hypothetical protein Tco_1447394 [Tanacetum coccineum]
MDNLNGENQVVLKSSAVTTADASDKRQQQPDFCHSWLWLQPWTMVGAIFLPADLSPSLSYFNNKLYSFLYDSGVVVMVNIDDGVTTSFQHRQTHYHMLIIKLQRHTIGIKDLRNQESSKYTKTKATKSNKERNDHSNVRLLAFKMVQGMSMLVQITRIKIEKKFIQLEIVCGRLQYRWAELYDKIKDVAVSMDFFCPISCFSRGHLCPWSSLTNLYSIIKKAGVMDEAEDVKSLISLKT